jgi:hypothetical protein
LNLLPYPEFEALRLSAFVRPSRAVEDVSDQEWMGGMWAGQAIGFTGVWALEDEPGRIGGVEIDFSELDEEEKKKLAIVLRLPIRHGMSLVDIQTICGQPIGTHRFVADRASYDYSVGSEWPYHLSCTVHEKEGLIHFALLRENALARCVSE